MILTTTERANLGLILSVEDGLALIVGRMAQELWQRVAMMAPMCTIETFPRQSTNFSPGTNSPVRPQLNYTEQSKA